MGHAEFSTFVVKIAEVTHNMTFRHTDGYSETLTKTSYFSGITVKLPGLDSKHRN